MHASLTFSLPEISKLDENVFFDVRSYSFWNMADKCMMLLWVTLIVITSGLTSIVFDTICAR